MDAVEKLTQELEEMKTRQHRLEHQLRRLNKQIAGANKQFHESVVPLIEILEAAQGAFKVLTFLYAVGKPLFWLGSIAAAISLAWSKLRG